MRITSAIPVQFSNSCYHVTSGSMNSEKGTKDSRFITQWYFDLLKVQRSYLSDTDVGCI